MQKLLFIILFISGAMIACNSDTPSTEEEEENGQDNQEETVNTQARQRIKISTQYGDMVFELFNETPKHRNNFIKLAQEGFYDSLMFHRVQLNFMIQGGDPDSRGEVKPEQMLGARALNYTIPAEINEKFIMRQGALVGYHQGGKKNRKKASHGSQFMVIHGQPLRKYQIQDISQENGFQYTDQQIKLYEQYGGTPQMDGKYTVFGQLVEGRHVLHKIVNVKTYRMQKPTWPDRPLEDIRMTVTVLDSATVQ